MNKLHSLRIRTIGLILSDTDTVSKARQTVLEAAGLDESSVTFTRTEETTCLGRNLCEVEFTGEDLHYEYYIDTETLEIIGQDFRPVAI